MERAVSSGVDGILVCLQLDCMNRCDCECGSCGLEPGGKAGGTMTHAEYFSTHYSALAPFFVVAQHGLTRLPRIFFFLWVPLAQLFLAMGLSLTSLSAEANGAVGLLLMVPLRMFARVALNKAYAGNAGSRNFTMIGGIAMGALALPLLIPIIVWGSANAASSAVAVAWVISWLVGYVIEFAELYLVRKLAECTSCLPCCDLFHQKH
jgi:hypothetical protein